MDLPPLVPRRGEREIETRGREGEAVVERETRDEL
jgi:hypothetical protein